MIMVKELTPPTDSLESPAITVELPYDLRKKSRLRAQSRCGREVGIQLPRGSELVDGQRLVAETGEVVEIVASAEMLSTVRADDVLKLLKAAYHLGNRHVPLQVTEQWLRYQHDHVLDDMVRGLGLTVTVEPAPFQPESGAYGRTGPEYHHHHYHQHGDHDHAEPPQQG